MSTRYWQPPSTFAGFVAFESGHAESARHRAREALAAAEKVGSATQIATAHALLGSLAFRANDRSIAATHLEAARMYLPNPGTVTARARRSILDLAALLRQFERISTPALTPVSTLPLECVSKQI